MKETIDFSAILKQHEKQTIETALEWNGWNKSRTAKALGWSRGNLHSKLRQHFGDKYDCHSKK